MNFRKLKQFFLGSIFTVIFCLTIFAQTQTAPTTANQTTANENSELNITEERITETNFARSTAVELKDDNRGNLLVQVGVGVRAERIDVLLRGVFGHVTFRGSLESIRQRIEQNRANRQAAP
ncbi:MAG: hypothetical protein M3033_14695 [Acidobacteriota bacterium]|nr:hypothetical protein [Acidobacteriota bacterium]